MLLEESRDDVGSESERNTTVVFAPACNVLVRIRPQEIAQETTVGNLGTVSMDAETRLPRRPRSLQHRDRERATYVSGAHHSADLLHRVEIGAQTAVHGEDLLVDDSGDGKAVEAVGEGLPQLNVVTALALVVEAVDSVDGGTLVVATEDEEVLGVLDLVGQEQANGLEGLLTSVDIVTEEEVVGLWREAAVLEETEQIVVLTVDIAADL